MNCISPFKIPTLFWDSKGSSQLSALQYMDAFQSFWWLMCILIFLEGSLRHLNHLRCIIMIVRGYPSFFIVRFIASACEASFQSLVLVVLMLCHPSSFDADNMCSSSNVCFSLQSRHFGFNDALHSADYKCTEYNVMKDILPTLT